jgi:hypothetical protein
MDSQYPWRQRSLLSNVGATGVFLYIIAIIFPLPGWIPVTLLVIASIVTAIYSSGADTPAVPRAAIYLVVFFIIVYAISVITSQAFEYSLQLSVSLLPALLIFYLITETLISQKDMERLFVCCSVAALLIAIGSLWVARDYGIPISLRPPMDFNKLVRWSPILVVKNDLTILALIAPFSAALVCRKPLSIPGVLAAISILISLCTVILFQSRGATATMVVGIIGVALVLRSRPVIVSIAGVLLLAITIDAWQGFPLADRFVEGIQKPEGRLWLGRRAWRQFTLSPWLGNGLHTFSLNSSWAPPWPHNLFLEALSGQGVFGLFSLCALIGYVIFVSWSGGQSNQQNVRFLSAGTFGSVMGFSFSSLIELSFIREWVILFLFLLVALAANLARQTQSSLNRN